MLPRSFVRWMLLLAVPALLWPVLAWLHREPLPPPGVHVVRTADFVPAATAHPPTQTASAEPRALPDDWRQRPGDVREGWYRVAFEVGPADDVPWAAYLPSVRMNAAVWLDGELVGDGGRFDEPVARNWRRPLLIAFPGERLPSGSHRIDLRVRTDLPDTGLLGPVYVGPHDALAALHTRRLALTHDAVAVITLCLVIAGVFTGALWVRSRDVTYGRFAAAAFAWTAVNLNLLVVDIPLATAPWWLLWYLAVVAWVVTLTRFVLAFTDADAPLVRRALRWMAIAGVAVLVPLGLAGSPWLHGAARVWLTGALPILVAAALQLLRVLRDRGDDLGVAVPHVLGLGVVGCALHDWLVHLGIAGPTYDWFLPFAAPPVFIGMGIALLRRFVDALRASAALVADLERRVDAERAALAASYARLQDVERARVLAEERERLMREMHDGLGSHLVSTLALLERDAVPRDAVAAAVRAALDDLRLMVDALEPLDGDLLGALAMLRARLQPRLEAAGLRVEWRVTDLPRVPDLGARAVLQVLRILQEAVTNVIRHAEARTLTVRTETRLGHGVAVAIVDDGRGFDVDGARGRGLHHMRRRAVEIGAVLVVASTAAGTTVRLAIPLAREEAA